MFLEHTSSVLVSLHVAAARGQTDCLSVLLAHSVDLSITDAAGIHTSVLPLWKTLKCSLLSVLMVHQEGRLRPFFLEFFCRFESATPRCQKQPHRVLQKAPPGTVARFKPHFSMLPLTFWCFLFDLQSKSPVDAADVSGRTALHHAGERTPDYSALERLLPQFLWKSVPH